MLQDISIDRQQIVDLCGVMEPRIWGIYMYGSQVYGTNSESSDYDFTVVASSLHNHKEFNDGTYNVHIKTQDLFQDELRAHKMAALECMYAPDFAMIQRGNLFDGFKLKINKLKKRSIAESKNAWHHGVRLIIENDDIYRGSKSLWHALRIPMFALQIMKKGHIYDFTKANPYWEKIVETQMYKLNDFKILLRAEMLRLENEIKKM